MLLTARAVQGLFGALMAPAALSLLTVTFAEGKERARAFGVYGAIAGGGSAIGLIMGGVLTEYISWRWTLLVNVPIAVLAAITATRVLSESKVRGNTSRRVELTPLGEQLRDRLAPAWSEAEAALADARATARHMDGTLRLGWPPTASSPV